MPRRDRPAAERRFWLARTPEEGVPELHPDDLRHALTVLRLGPGDRLWGLDGGGRAWPLVVREATRRSLALEPDGDAREEPPPGRPGAPLPELRVAVALPRPNRVEALVERLTQLGVTEIQPLVTHRAPGHGREAGDGRVERWLRTAREACKQCDRLWLPRIPAPVALGEVLGGLDTGPTALLDPGATRRLGDWAEEHRRSPGPWTLLVGPEGGFDPEELALARDAGAQGCWLGPHVLRLETAAELGCGILAHVLGAPPST